MQITIALTVLAVGLFFLPAWVFVPLSTIVAFALPAAHRPRAYPLLARGAIALAMAGVGFLCAWGLRSAIDGGLSVPLAQWVPPLGALCEWSRTVLFSPLSMNVSPACRLLLDDPRREYGFGLILEIWLLISLICIKMRNLHGSLRDSDTQADGSAGLWLFATSTLALSFLAQRVDSLLASLIDGPYEIPTAVSYLGAVIYILCMTTLQLILYPARTRRVGL